MPATLFYSFRHASRAFLAIAFTAGTVFFAPSAYADPHAVFYTDRAQEQVFYNVLAALNQADYVEPVVGQFSRANRVQDREIASDPIPGQNPNAFKPESNPLITSTRTELPAALTRNITLEGNDLWTAYLVHQFANETDIRRSANEFLREQLCTNGLGIVGCDTNSGPAQRQNTAFPTDINKYEEIENIISFRGLGSGTKAAKDSADELTGTKKVGAIGSDDFKLGPDGPSQPGPTEPEIPEYLKVPQAFFADMAKLRENTEDNQGASGLVNRVSSGVIASNYGTRLNPNALNDIKISGDGKEIEVKEDITFDESLDAIAGIGSLLPGALNIAYQGIEEGEAFKKYREETPALAQHTLTKKPGGGVDSTIRVPSTAIVAQLDEAVSLGGDAIIGQKTAASTEIRVPGLTPALSRAQVAGISTQETPEDPKKPGEVAGIASFAASIYDLYNKYYNQPTTTTNNPTTGLISPTKETAFAQFFQAISSKNSSTTANDVECGFCTSQNAILETDKNNLYRDLYCFFYPRTPYCATQKL